MKRLLLTAVLAAGWCSGADARPRLFGRPAAGPVAQAVRGAVYAVAQPVGVAAGALRAGLSDGLTEGHAASMAAAGRIFHSGRFTPGATHEGVGFSSVSAEDAIRHCCYWGQRQPVAVSVRPGPGGWYAVAQYR